jgi:hypothetical protein
MPKDIVHKNGTIRGTGLLSAGSFLQLLRSISIANLRPRRQYPEPRSGTYDVEIKKDGYHTWSKKIEITAELVTKNAQLFLQVKLGPLTYTGALSSQPLMGKLLYRSLRQRLRQNGLYVQSSVHLRFPQQNCSSNSQNRRDTTILLVVIPGVNGSGYWYHSNCLAGRRTALTFF